MNTCVPSAMGRTEIILHYPPRGKYNYSNGQGMRLWISIGKKRTMELMDFLFFFYTERTRRGTMRPICSPDLWPAASHRIKTNSYGLKKKKKSSQEDSICLSGNNVTLQLFFGCWVAFFFISYCTDYHLTNNKLHLKLVKNNKNKIDSIHEV